jgi:Icc-related predicted phosphoesterase
MTIKIASDVHGAFDQLHALLKPTDSLVLLGDYLDFLDYDDLSGMISEFVPKATIKNVLGLIQAEKLEEAKVAMDAAMAEAGDLFAMVEKAAHDRYERLFAGLPCETWLIWGNVDFPHVLKKHLRPHTHLIENEVLTIDGRKCGFVAGSPPMRYSFGMPGEVTREKYRERLYGLGPVDHLFVHPPPSIPDLVYDVTAERDEEGSEDLLAYIDAFAPKTVHFGHIHQPRKTTLVHKEKTELINCGFFKRSNALVEL